MPNVLIHCNPDWRTTVLAPVVPQPAPEPSASHSIDRYAYWSGRKRFDRCDVCGKMEMIQGEVRTLVDRVVTQVTAVGDCGQWMFEAETLTDEQKEQLLAAAAKGRKIPPA